MDVRVVAFGCVERTSLRESDTTLNILELLLGSLIAASGHSDSLFELSI